MRIFENYEKVKHEIIKVIDGWRVSYYKIDRENRMYGYWFPYYKKYIPHGIKVLKLALKDLERVW